MTMGISWTLTAIAIILMILRTYTNIAITKSFGWDYHWAIITLVSRESLLPRAAACNGRVSNIQPSGYGAFWAGVTDRSRQSRPRQPRLPSNPPAAGSFAQMGLVGANRDIKRDWTWETRRLCFAPPHTGPNSIQEEMVHLLCRHQRHHHQYRSNRPDADTMYSTYPAVGQQRSRVLRPCSKDRPRGIFSRK